VTPARVVEMADAQRIALWVEGERIRYRCPAGTNLDVIRDAVATCREHVLALLRNRRTCAACRYERPIMLTMEPGQDGEIWWLCSSCWRDGALATVAR
jgi:hypothetical protein